MTSGPYTGTTTFREKRTIQPIDARTILALLLIFVLALTVRSYYNWEPATKDGYQLTGGSDPYYHKRVSDYVAETGEHLQQDKLLNYPLGGTNNRPPVFDWSLTIIGVAFAPFNGGDVDDTIWLAYLIMPAIWGALTIFPVFFIGRAQFGRGAGLWGAFIFALMSGHITHTTLALADHDAYLLFFIVTAFYFFMRALMTANEGRWVENWSKLDSITDGFKAYFEHNRVSIGYAGLAGMSVAAVALAWKGFPYLLVIIFGYAVIQLLVNMLGSKDSLAVGVVVGVTMGLPLLLSFPYYQTMGFFNPWWSAPFYIFVGTMVVALVLVPTRDLPWTFVVFATILVTLLSYGLLKYILVDIGEQLFSGQGYFTRTKLFNTIAEAQPPQFPVFVFAYGIVTTWLALAGAAYMVFLIWQQRQWKADYLFVLVWAVTSIYMARSAVRFIYNATPVFALLSGWVVWKLIQWADFPGWITAIRRSSGGGMSAPMRYKVRDKFHAVWKSTHVKQPAVALGIIFLVVGANGLHALDAGVPFEGKKDVDTFIWDTIPTIPLGPLGEISFKPDEYNSSQRSNLTLYPDGVAGMYNRTNSDLWYTGIAGPNFPSDYWVDGLSWLATQDTNLAIEDRPAFISWWDYGFWAIDIGEHPTVADNFQWGYQLAGNFIAAQSEKEAMALMLLRLLEAEREKKDPDSNKVRQFLSMESDKPKPVRETLLEYYSAEQVAQMEDIFTNAADYIPTKDNGELEDVHKKNAAIWALRPILMELEVGELANVLHQIESITGNSIRYFAVDQRLMPFSATNTGIFYAPITLADLNVNDFIEVMFITDTGERLTNDEAAQRAREDPQNFQITDQELVYKESFLNSMFYRAFIGFSGLDLDGSADDGIPGVSGDLAQQFGPLPAWNMTYFKLVQSIPGLTIIKYYDGAIISGQVKTPEGRGLPNVRVTLMDTGERGRTPHDTVFTDEYGNYELTAVAGNLTLVVSQGPFQSDQEWLAKTSNNILAQEEGIIVSEAQAYRQGFWKINKDIEVDAATISGQVYWDENGDETYDEGDDAPVEGVKIILRSNFSGREITVTTDEEGQYSLTGVAPGEYYLEQEVEGHNLELASYLGQGALRAGQEVTVDGILSPGVLTGTLDFSGMADRVVNLKLTDLTNGTELSLKEVVEYSFGRLLPGNFTLTLEEEDIASNMAGNSRLITLGAGQTLYNNLTLEPGLTIKGRALLNNKPVPDMTIDIFQLDGVLEDLVLTDEEGRFTLVLPPGLYTIHALHADGDSTYVFTQMVDTATFEGELEVILRTAGALSGRVFYDDNGNGEFDEDQEILQGDINLFLHGEGGIQRINVDGRGTYEAYLLPGKYTAHVSTDRPGEAGPTPFTALLSTQMGHVDRTLELGLRPAHLLTGRLVQEIDNDIVPLVGTVKISSARGELLRPSDEAGFFLPLPADTYEFDIVKFGYEMVEQVELNFNRAKEIDLLVKPTDIPLTGRVTYQGAPLPGATVTLKLLENPENEANWPTITGAGGYYSLVAPPRDYLVEVELNLGDTLYRETNQVLLPLGSKGVNLNLETQLSKRVRGHLTYQGQPEGGILVFTDIQDPEKVYRIPTEPVIGFDDYLPRGQYYVTLDDESGARHFSLIETAIVDESIIFEAELFKDDRWRGSIKNQVDEAPIEDNVELTLSHARGKIYVTADSDGKIDVDLPAGEYEVVINHPGYQPYQASLLVEATTIEDIFLEPIPIKLTGQLTYRTVDGQSLPLADAPFKLELTRDPDRITLNGSSDEGGNYTLEGVLPGNYRLIVDFISEDGSVKYDKSTTKRLEAGKLEQSLNLRITPDYQLAGRAFYDRNFNGKVDDFEVIPNTQVEVWNVQGDRLRTTLEVDETGRFSHYRGSGGYLLIAKATSLGGNTLTATSTIELDKALEVDLNLARGVALNMTLTYNGKPVAVDEIEITGPVGLTLEPQDGRVQATLPVGDYQLSVDYLDDSGPKDWRYRLDENLKVEVGIDNKALERELEKTLAFGFEVTLSSATSQSTRLGESALFYFNFTNTGDTKETFLLEALSNGIMPDNWSVQLDPDQVFEVEAGATIPVVILITPSEEITPKVFTNYQVNFTWSDEKDNRIDDIYKTFELRVTPEKKPKPNFQVSTPKLIGSTDEGSDIEFKAKVTNPVDHSGSFEVVVRFKLNNEILGQDQLVLIGPGETKDVSVFWSDAKAGSYSITVIVDPDSLFQESNETDNDKTFSFPINEKQKGGPFDNPLLVFGLPVVTVAGLIVIIASMRYIRKGSVAGYGVSKKKR